MFAALAIEGEIRIGTVVAILKPDRAIAVGAVHAGIAEFQILAVGDVHHVAGMVGDVGIQRVLAVAHIKTEVTVFIVPALVHIGTILIIKNRQSHSRNLKLNLTELLKERTVKIKFLSKFQRIPLVAIPDYRIVNFKRGQGIIEQRSASSR